MKKGWKYVWSFPRISSRKIFTQFPEGHITALKSTHGRVQSTKPPPHDKEELVSTQKHDFCYLISCQFPNYLHRMMGDPLEHVPNKILGHLQSMEEVKSTAGIFCPAPCSTSKNDSSETFSNASRNHPLTSLLSWPPPAQNSSAAATNNKSSWCGLPKEAYLSLKLFSNRIQNHLVVCKH